MFKKSFLALAVLLLAIISHAQVGIIPQPVETTVATGGGAFRINRQTKIVAGKDLQNSVKFINGYLKKFYGFELASTKNAKATNAVHLRAGKIAGLAKPGYTLDVKKTGIVIQGSTDTAVFYGIQSLIQLLPTVKGTDLSVPYVSVKDYPRFAYRGMHLDVARNFFPVSFVKKYIDNLALHKMNYFHWHLTDDQGWRIEISKYPGLTTAGAFRDGTIIGHYPGTGNDNTRYGGFYTKQEVKEVIAYAAERYITIIPEIELPGHSSAAIAAYPWLSCFPAKETSIPKNASEASQLKKGKKVQETWGVFEDIYCAGKDSTFLFLQDVLDEVVALFPSKMIHIGGDEAPKDHWKICPSCQARIKKEGLKDEHQLQSYFIQRIEKHVNAKGRTIIGWDEILEGGLAPNAVVMSWRGEKGGIDAAKENHFVIMTPGSHVYFDHAQTRDKDSVTFGGYTPLEKVYSYEPVPAELPAGKEEYVLGAQANLWSEYIRYDSKAEFQIFPRMSALSEVLWTPKEKRNWEKFQAAMIRQFQRYDLWDVNYFHEK
ncbi:MAG: beta-N-acetylhexosaminidase [Chitinophagaceae bacterium]|nr:MAG: beta-N-acetylhexosaminidase [Chitinophagaceae bacterium]